MTLTTIASVVAQDGEDHCADGVHMLNPRVIGERENNDRGYQYSNALHDVTNHMGHCCSDIHVVCAASMPSKSMMMVVINGRGHMRTAALLLIFHHLEFVVTIVTGYVAASVGAR